MKTTEVKKIAMDNWGALCWVDDNGNGWNVDCYTKDEAELASKSLINCKDCLDCNDCIDCTDCMTCTGCTNCTDCTFLVGAENKNSEMGDSKVACR